MHFTNIRKSHATRYLPVYCLVVHLHKSRIFSPLKTLVPEETNFTYESVGYFMSMEVTPALTAMKQLILMQ